MLYWLSEFSGDYAVLNLFRYLTFRTGGAVITAMIIAFVCGPAIIRWLKSRQTNGQPIREDGPQSHVLTKQGTPTMGGMMMLLAIAVSTLLWADLSNAYVWAVLAVTMGFGAIGFADDYLKVTKRDSGGLPGRVK
ncbi:MAG: phospho-N-acetylmuramoyl-pentapeptide-transferase, partial [Rhodospirillaceae bacterium]|nr:phospho-N-acetylmuramoyl-pentapeptide-transferase [Rhodospirillaceae bacterium]